jgi:hypothetical protein
MLMVTCVSATIAAETIRPFTPGSLSQVLAQREGKRLSSFYGRLNPGIADRAETLVNSSVAIEAGYFADRNRRSSDTPQLLSRTQAAGLDTGSGLR